VDALRRSLIGYLFLFALCQFVLILSAQLLVSSLVPVLDSLLEGEPLVPFVFASTLLPQSYLLPLSFIVVGAIAVRRQASNIFLLHLLMVEALLSVLVLFGILCSLWASLKAW
jgi:hypothetical protein